MKSGFGLRIIGITSLDEVQPPHFSSGVIFQICEEGYPMRYYGVSMIPTGGEIVPILMPIYGAEAQNSLERGSRPYTVVEILKEVFKEDFQNAIQCYMDRCPEGASKAVKEDTAKDFHLVWLSEPRVESSLRQPACTTAVDLIFNCTVEALVPTTDEYEPENVMEKKRFYAGFRVRYLLGLWRKTCSAPMIAPCDYFPSDLITEQKTAITNQYLLPIMYAEDYAKAGRRMLERYYKEALDQPTAVDGMELARRMKLEVRKIRFQQGSDIQGRIYFDWTWVTIRDKNGNLKKEKIPPMTILINTDLCPTPEIENSTIIHECCHVYLDLLFFKLQMLSGKPYTSYTSRKKRKKGYSQNNGPIDWMELQAEKLPAYVLMEEENTKKKIEALLAEKGGQRTPENMLWVMNSLAVFFNVSRSMAKYRMIELGYPEAEGIYVYVNSQHIPDYGCCGKWKPGITYTISRGEASQLLWESPDFRIALSSGCYTYIEGHYCLDDEAYIETSRYNQLRRLTAYARHHIDECCLSFSVRGRYVHAEYEDGQAARKKEVKNKYLSRHELDSEPETKERILQNKQFADDSVLWTKVKQDIPDSFKDAIQHIIDLKGISQNELAMRMGVSRAAPRKWCTGRTSLRHVVALCIAMDVRGDVGEELVRLAGLSFQNNLEHNILRGMLYETKDLTVARANEIMRQNKLPALTNGEDEEIAS